MSEHVSIRGEANVELTRKIAHGIERVNMNMHNTISRGGRRYMLAGAVANLFGGTGGTYGRIAARTTLFNTYSVRYSSSSSESWLQGGTDYKHALSCAVLGISDSEYDGINADSTILPLLASDGTVDSNKVRALANIETVASSDVGIADISKPDSVVNLNMIGNKFKFPAGTGDGTITGVAMIPGSWAPGKVPFGGAIVSKLIEPALILNNHTLSTKFVAPGIDGLSGSSVRFNLNYSGVSSRVYDIYTGTVTDGQSSDWFPTYSNEAVMLETGNFIATIDAPNKQLVCYDKNNAYNRSTLSFGYNTKVNSIEAASLYRNDTTGEIYAFFRYLDRYDTKTYGYNKIYMSGEHPSIDFTNGLTDSSFYSFLSSLGITLPSGWTSSTDVGYILPMTIGQYTGFRVGITNTNGTHVYEDDVFITTDTSNVIGGLIDIIPCTNWYDCVWGVGSDYGVIFLGTSGEKFSSATSRPANSGYTSITSGQFGNISNYCYIYQAASNSIGIPMQVSGRDTGYVENGRCGVYLSLRGQWFNWLSCLKLSQSQDKTGEAEMTVQYDYSVN